MFQKVLFAHSVSWTQRWAHMFLLALWLKMYISSSEKCYIEKKMSLSQEIQKLLESTFLLSIAEVWLTAGEGEVRKGVSGSQVHKAALCVSDTPGVGVFWEDTMCTNFTYLIWCYTLHFKGSLASLGHSNLNSFITKHNHIFKIIYIFYK